MYRLIQLALCASACLATPASNSPPATIQCHDVNINVAARSVNKLLPPDLPASKLPELIPRLLTALESATEAVVDGKYRIAGRFCEPLRNVNKRHDTLQILVHGVGYTKDYWSGPSTHYIGPGSTNQSWVYYAAEQGYPTLAVDRLCNGHSSHPNGIFDCQLPLEAAILEKVIQAARDGELPGIATKFSKIIYVGHSYGSMIANFIAASTPTAFDQLHLTGFSEQLIKGASSIILNPKWQPAYREAPQRFANVDIGYLIATDRNTSDSVFYGDDMDPAVQDYAWESRGIVTVGELLTAVLGQGAAKGFQGDVFVVNGNQDNLFCASGPVSAVKGTPGDCDSERSSQRVAQSYPAARNFDYLDLPNVGHSLGLHKDAAHAITAAHKFMARSGY